MVCLKKTLMDVDVFMKLIKIQLIDDVCVLVEKIKEMDAKGT